jgi:hypothetical protein
MNKLRGTAIAILAAGALACAALVMAQAGGARARGPA